MGQYIPWTLWAVFRVEGWIFLRSRIGCKFLLTLLLFCNTSPPPPNAAVLGGVYQGIVSFSAFLTNIWRYSLCSNALSLRPQAFPWIVK